ncbi:hypothetical protein K474DRAFT_1696552 [Panus rudis PR-1116 ss-1]|nr:hypothetical protein K474DRAFT_1696552 [Panus rudis PR-1116 ss-1]
MDYPLKWCQNVFNFLLRCLSSPWFLWASLITVFWLFSAGKVSSLERQLADSQAAESSTTEENRALRSEHEQFRLRLQNASREARQLRAELDELRRVHDREDAEFRNKESLLNQKLENLRRAKTQTEQKLSFTEGLLRDTQALLATRTAELQDCQPYLSSTDKLSHSDILSHLKHLNSAIFQTAGQIADAIKFEASDDELQDGMESAVERAKSVVGEGTVTLLRRMRHDEDPLAVQMALQADAVARVAEIINQWDPTGDEKLNERISHVFARILQNETQTIAGRWRALARNYIEDANARAQIQTRYQETLHDDFAAIINTARAQASHERIEHILEGFQEQIVSIVDQAMITRRAIGQQVISSEFRLIAPVGGERFGTLTMHNAYAGKRHDEKKDEEAGIPVLCCVQLGLESSAPADEGQWKVMEKGEVALQTLFEELLHEFGRDCSQRLPDILKLVTACSPRLLYRTRSFWQYTTRSMMARNVR